MQQAYRVIRVVAEAQTIRIILPAPLDSILLDELSMACTSFKTGGSDGIKAIVLDFTSQMNPNTGKAQSRVSETEAIEQAYSAIHVIEQPVLAVVQSGTIQEEACKLIDAADLRLIAEEAVLKREHDVQTGSEAARRGYATWATPAHLIEHEMERILDMLRQQSAVALRLTKASVRLGTKHTKDATAIGRLEALRQVNDLYLTNVMHTEDAAEGLKAFLEKRNPI